MNMMAVPICNTSIIINWKDREICVGLKCIKYRTRKQFEIACEVAMMLAAVCERMEMKKWEETKRSAE